jgi:hypothetical protein
LSADSGAAYEDSGLSQFCHGLMGNILDLTIIYTAL